jgi:hypothetical protein
MAKGGLELVGCTGIHQCSGGRLGKRMIVDRVRNERGTGRLHHL